MFSLKSLTFRAVFLGFLVVSGVLAGLSAQGQSPPATQPAAARMDPALARDWMTRWEKNILGDMKNRYCDKETGEEIGWLVSPFLNGFCHGYMATHDTKWIDLEADWADSVVKRAVKEPDGYLGWPKAAGASTGSVDDFYTDNELGDAMFCRPLVLLAGEINKTPALKARYGAKAYEWLKLSAQMFEKWNARGAWREAPDVPGGGLWVVPEFGIDQKSGNFTAGYAKKGVEGFSLPDNKQNIIAMWLVTMGDVMKKPVYTERAEKWWRVMKSRMKMRAVGTAKYFVWNYWDQGGPWDKKPNGDLKHWVGVHPNGGYYGVDLEGIVTAYEHGLVFTREDIDRLIATNRDFMWNQQIKGAKFQRIDGGAPDARWKGSPGVLWEALTPYDETLRKVFEANHDPSGWAGLSVTPEYVARFGRAAGFGGPETGP